MKHHRYAILGAGCAGLSLAWHFLAAGSRDRFVILDGKTAFSDDRTWCFWDTEATPFSHLRTHSWTSWAVISQNGRRSNWAPSRYRYGCIRSIDFYEHVLEQLSRSAQIDLLLGVTVLRCVPEHGQVRIETSGGTFQVDQVFDSTKGAALAPTDATHNTPFAQHFRGLTVKATKPAFEPQCPLLMDFRTGQQDGPHFFYVLPFSETEALVENTYLMPCSVSPQRHRVEIATYLRTNHDLATGDFSTLREEAGRIPMDPDLSPSPLHSSVIRIGLAGAAARPSTGYAFVRIQRHSRWLADTFINRVVAPNPIQSRRRTALDRIFLAALTNQVGSADQIFFRMFNQVSPDRLLRFLSDRASLSDTMAVMCSLPVGQFVKAGLRSLIHQFGSG